MNDISVPNAKRRRMKEELERVLYGVDKVSDVLYRDDPACQDLYLFDLLRAAWIDWGGALDGAGMVGLCA